LKTCAHIRFTKGIGTKPDLATYFATSGQFREVKSEIQNRSSLYYG